ELAGKRIAAGARERDQVLVLAEDAAGTLDHAVPERRQEDAALRALDERGAEHGFDLLDSGAEGRLRDAAEHGGAAEMERLGEGAEIAEVAGIGQGNHRNYRSVQ